MIVNFKLRTGSFFFMGKISLSRHNTQDVDLDTLTYEEKKQLLAYYNKGFGYFVTTPKLDEVLVLPEICGETPEPNVQTDTPFSVFVSEDGTKITGNSIAKANIEVRGEGGEVIASDIITARMLDTEGTPTYALLAGTEYTLDMSCNVDKETKAKVFINSSTNNSSENSELTITFDTTDTTNSIPFPIESNQTGLYSFVASDSTSSFANSILEVRSFTRLTPMSNSSTIQFENSIVSGQVISFEITGYTPDETPIDMTDVFMYSEHPLLNIDSYAISSQNKLNARFNLLDPSLSSVTTNVGFVINNEYTIQTEITVTNT